MDFFVIFFSQSPFWTTFLVVSAIIMASVGNKLDNERDQVNLLSFLSALGAIISLIGLFIFAYHLSSDDQWYYFLYCVMGAILSLIACFPINLVLAILSKGNSWLFHVYSISIFGIFITIVR